MRSICGQQYSREVGHVVPRDIRLAGTGVERQVHCPGLHWVVRVHEAVDGHGAVIAGQEIFRVTGHRRGLGAACDVCNKQCVIASCSGEGYLLSMWASPSTQNSRHLCRKSQMLTWTCQSPRTWCAQSQACCRTRTPCWC